MRHWRPPDCAKPFIARCGYLPSDNMERAHGNDSPQAKSAQTLEQHVLGADRIVVTTTAIRHKILHRYQLRPECVRIIPNYVDIGLFAPTPCDGRRPNRVLYVGRLESEKNPRALFDAVEGLNVELVMVGQRIARGDIGRGSARATPARHVSGQRTEREPPRLYNSSAAFIMPSFIEGHPKALLEPWPAAGR